MGLFSAESVEDTWRVELTWRDELAWMRRVTKATWQGRACPTGGAGGAGGANTWQEATQVHADAREGRHMARGVGKWRAHGLVGPSESIGAVKRMRYALLCFILTFF